MTNAIQSFADAVTAAPVAVVVQSAVVTESVAAIRQWFTADLDSGLALHKFMRALGDAPTFETWETVRKTAISDVYRAKYPKANDDAANVWWNRLLKKVRDYVNENGFDFTIPSKPKATTPEAVKKAEARAKANTNPFADKTDAEVKAAQAEVAEKIKAGGMTPDEMAEACAIHAKARKELDKREAAAKKEADKAAKVEAKNVYERVIARIKALDIADVGAVEMLLDKQWSSIIRLIPDAEVMARAAELEHASAHAGGAIADAFKAAAKRAPKAKKVA